MSNSFFCLAQIKPSLPITTPDLITVFAPMMEFDRGITKLTHYLK